MEDGIEDSTAQGSKGKEIGLIKEKLFKRRN